MKAMILAAGLGTRFKPWTDNHPKALALVNGNSLLERNMLYLQSFGSGSDCKCASFRGSDTGMPLQTTKDGEAISPSAMKRTQVLETGGGLKKAAGLF